jgi:hypothetical protein
MAKKMVPEIQVARLRETVRTRDRLILTLEAKIEGLSAEVARLRDDTLRPSDPNTRDHSR